MDNQSSKRDRANELLADQAVFGLSPTESKELAILQRELSLTESSGFENAAAQVHQLFENADLEPLPAALRDSILQQAAEINFSSEAGSDNENGSGSAVATVMPKSIDSASKAGFKFSSAMPWLVSAVCLSVAIFTFVSNWEPPDAKPQQLRSQLLASAQDVVQVDWSPGTTPIKGVSGNVVWSDAQQSGFMLFDGLPPNDASKEQYQLWIFGKNRPEETPVDGGVFDIVSKGKTIVPIDAKLPVDAVVFAITIEPPGGVVVSKREKLPLIATVK